LLIHFAGVAMNFKKSGIKEEELLKSIGEERHGKA